MGRRIDEQVIVRLYLDGASGSAIAKFVGCCTSTVYNVLSRNSVETRDRVVCQNPVYINCEKLRVLYWDQEKSLAEIAALHNTSSEVIRRLMFKKQIPRRKKTHKFGGWNKGGKLPKEQRKQISETRKRLFSTGQLKHWNLGRHWSYEVRDKISKALLNGRDPAPNNYGPNWKKQRTSRLQLDNYTCQQCGARGNLEVHHWEPYRFSYNNSLDNLVTFCKDCHVGKHVTYRKEEFTQQAEREFYD